LIMSTPMVALTDAKGVSTTGNVGDTVLPLNPQMVAYWNNILSSDTLAWRQFMFISMRLRFCTKSPTSRSAQVIMGYSFDPCQADAGASTPQNIWQDNYIENMNQTISFAAWHNATVPLRMAKEAGWLELRGDYTYPATTYITRSSGASGLRLTTQGILLMKVIPDGTAFAALGDLYVDLRIRLKSRSAVVGSNLTQTTGVVAPGYYPLVAQIEDVVDPETKLVRRIVKKSKESGAQDTHGGSLTSYPEVRSCPSSIPQGVEDKQAPDWKRLCDDFETLLKVKTVFEGVIERKESFIVNGVEVPFEEKEAKKRMKQLNEKIDKRRKAFMASTFFEAGVEDDDPVDVSVEGYASS